MIEEPLAKRLSSASASDTSEKVSLVADVLIEHCSRIHLAIHVSAAVPDPQVRIQVAILSLNYHQYFQYMKLQPQVNR